MMRLTERTVSTIDPSPPNDGSKFSLDLSAWTPGLSKDLREFVELFVAHKVEFVIIGAHALAFHGYPRYTKDIDLFIRSSRENAEKVEALINEFGFSSLGLTAEDFYDPDVVVQLGFEPNRIDILTRIAGVPFDQVWTNRIPGVLDGLPVSFISKEDLLINKRSAGRPKDLADADLIDPA